MTRIPVVPTLLVSLAVATMIGLGIWQLERKGEKEALLAIYAQNASKPPIAFPPLGPVAKENLFRKSSANCLRLIDWQVAAGRDISGATGQRYVAHCATGAEGPGLIAALGVADRPDMKLVWKGGPLTGTITEEPDRRSIIERAFGKAVPLRPMLVVDKPPVPELRAAAQPSPDQIPNNHLFYAIQWFIFAAAAAVIYILALRRRAVDRTAAD